MGEKWTPTSIQVVASFRNLEAVSCSASPLLLATTSPSNIGPQAGRKTDLASPDPTVTSIKGRQPLPASTPTRTDQSPDSAISIEEQ